MLNMMKFVIAVVALLGIEATGLASLIADRPVALKTTDGYITTYANEVTGTDGENYRVSIDDVEIKETRYRFVSAYSLTGKYAEIFTAINLTHPNFHGRAYGCTRTQMKDKSSCKGSNEVRTFANDFIKKVVGAKNNIRNMEHFWSWEMGTKELIKQIEASVN
jgi:hypothetical protein